MVPVILHDSGRGCPCPAGINCIPAPTPPVPWYNPPMRILVTGGAGYIGSHTVKLLLARGHDVRVLDNLVLGHRAAVPADRLTVADLADAPAVDHLMMAHRIEAIVHFAAFAAVGESVKHPARYWQNNLVNTIALPD